MWLKLVSQNKSGRNNRSNVMQANIKSLPSTGDSTTIVSAGPCKPPDHAHKYLYHWLRNVVHNNTPVLATWDGQDWLFAAENKFRSQNEVAQMNYVWYGLVKIPLTPRAASKHTRKMLRTKVSNIRTVKSVKKKKD
jgi:hypothetical protein